MSLLPLDDPAAPPPSTPPAAARASDERHRPSASAATRRALALLPLLFLGVWAALDWHTVRDGVARLATADPWWLLAGLLFTYLGVVAAACVRQGAITDRLPPGALLASQIAAGAANHVLPASVGAHAVTLRFLRREGVPLNRATASIALYSLVRAVAKVPLLLVFVFAAPTAVPPVAELFPQGRALFLTAACLLLAPVAVAALFAVARPLRRPALDFVRTALTDARRLHTRPARLLPLWGGAAAAPLLQACVVACVGTALGLPLSWSQLLFAFLAASTAAGVVPAPGGIGPIDAALVLALAGYGTPLPAATATVIGYRVLTVWAPLPPGMLVLSAMVQRGRL
ncbi:lysylphosphatidylglycerol synthase transmembrane domain-containing protein [Streptomyces sp. FL07-04A]|uniref:lysylphosphatidylglycerol synthase transmembrane domain-containing protein n=1 Tax=Streptomyces sp. FL07-04A TaxID=3028658 RepID=UPI0029B3CBE7|nr:lysylphosphatidylglycerol synthase transmembrane domain-containing protein [Streptomyces sp. FL07-04A]MDX3577298.1 lysylphosphatidylglycerol synthase transmembrane domain-containing protein [Streptomyces sp. FL07-04A]